MEKYIKPDMEVVEMPELKTDTFLGSCDTKSPEHEI